MRTAISRVFGGLDQLPVIVWVTDATGSCTFCNRAWRAFTGASLQQSVGSGWLDWIHPADRQAVRAALTAAEGKPFTHEYRVRRQDGAFRRLHASGLPLQTGEFTGFVGASVDLTESAISAEHRRVLEQLDLLGRTSDEVFVRWRILPSLALEYVSGSVERMVGHAPDEFYANPDLALQLVLPEDRPIVGDFLKDPKVRLRPVTIRWRHRTGRTIWAEHRRFPVRDDLGRIAAVDVAIRDLTRERELERQRDAQSALTQALVRHLQDGLLAETAEGVVATTNVAFCRLFRIEDDPTHLTGTTLWSLRTRLFCDGIITPEGIRHLLAPWHPHERRQFTLNDGCTLECRYAPIAIDGKPPLRLWQFSDITAITRTTAELIHSKDQLRQLSAHAESVREDERRSVAHTLHDDLGQIFTNMRLELGRAVQMCQLAETARSSEMVDRLQAVAGMIDLGVTTLRQVTTSLRPAILDELGLAAAVQWEARMFASRTGIRCRVRIAPDTRRLTDAVATALYRILLEALNNIVKHASAGSVWITLCQRGGALLLTVRDNGRGVTEQSSRGTMGLLGMRERALTIGADFHIGRPAGPGTRVVVVVPNADVPGGPETDAPEHKCSRS